MAKFQVFFALLAFSAAMAAPTQEVAPSDDQKAEEGAALVYSAPQYHGYYDSSLASPYAYAAAPAVLADHYGYAPAAKVVAASYESILAAQPYVHAAQPYVKYTPTVKAYAAPAAYAYAPASYGYAAAPVYPTSYSYSKMHGSW